MSKIIGIDLGTTNSVVAVMEGGEPVVITNPEGSGSRRRSWRSPRAVTARRPGGEAPGGHQPENTIFSIKRFMGRRHSEVNEEMKMVPYRSRRRRTATCA